MDKFICVRLLGVVHSPLFFAIFFFGETFYRLSALFLASTLASAKKCTSTIKNFTSEKRKKKHLCPINSHINNYFPPKDLRILFLIFLIYGTFFRFLTKKFCLIVFDLSQMSNGFQAIVYFGEGTKMKKKLTEKNGKIG